MPVSLVVGLLVLALSAPVGWQLRGGVDPEALPYAPRTVVCHRTATTLVADGRLDEPAWLATPWSAPFVDIDGVRPVRHATRMKVLWDDHALYVAAELEEPDLWATLTTRDAVIFQDHDFEVFLDPGGDTHGYYELEVNALGTAWDLFLVRPYRDGGPALHAWDIAGLQVGVQVRGTLNRPGDRDDGWTVELVLPWETLREAAPERRAPRDGEQWRLNFSRVQWTLEQVDGAYRKRVNPATGKALPEDNWVWSPQGAVDMHMPERWGVVQFSDAVAGTRRIAVDEDRNDSVKWALRRLYYRQRAHRQQHGRYATTLGQLGAHDIQVEGLEFAPVLHGAPSFYEMVAAGFDDRLVHIAHDGRVWVTPAPAARGQ